MKKLVFGLIATVMLSVSSFGQDFDKQGLAHNEALKNILMSYDNTLTKSNVFNKTMEQLKKQMSAEEFNKMFVFKNYSDPTEMLNELYANKTISSELFSLVSEDILVLQNTTNSKEVEDFVTIKLNEERKLSESDEKIYLSYLSVAKHSSNFWDPNEENGIKYVFFKDEVFILSKSGKGPDSVLEYKNNSKKINWHKVFICDMIADLCSGFNALVAAGASAISAVNQSNMP